MADNSQLREEVSDVQETVARLRRELKERDEVMEDNFDAIQAHRKRIQVSAHAVLFVCVRVYSCVYERVSACAGCHVRLLAHLFAIEYFCLFYLAQPASLWWQKLAAFD